MVSSRHPEDGQPLRKELPIDSKAAYTMLPKQDVNDDVINAYFLLIEGDV